MPEAQLQLLLYIFHIIRSSTFPALMASRCVMRDPGEAEASLQLGPSSVVTLYLRRDHW